MSAATSQGGKPLESTDPKLDEVEAASVASMDASDPPAFGGATGVGTPEGGDDDRIERIRQRAYELWQESGSPPDREMDFWLQAETEIDQVAPREVNGR